MTSLSQHRISVARSNISSASISPSSPLLLSLLRIASNHQLTLSQITALYNFGKFQYSYGSYGGAADYLYHFRVLSTDAELNTSAHWGKLASDILTGKWEVALEELNTLRETIDSRSSASLLAAERR